MVNVGKYTIHYHTWIGSYVKKWFFATKHLVATHLVEKHFGATKDNKSAAIFPLISYGPIAHLQDTNEKWKLLGLCFFILYLRNMKTTTKLNVVQLFLSWMTNQEFKTTKKLTF